MITSCVGVEGKTTTISNLAIALARAGHRVALVDLDLRKPMVGRFFGLELRPGLADVAIGRIDLERALVPVRLRTEEPIKLSRGARRVSRGEEPRAGGAERDAAGELFVLPAGFLPASPGELVGTQAVAGILARLHEEMDFVLVDAPPLLTVSDAATLSTRVDAVLVVVRLGLVNRPMLRDLARNLEASPAPKLGFILTGSDGVETYGAGTYAYRSRREHPSRGAAAEVVSEGPDRADAEAEAVRALADGPSSSPRVG
jgi:Mrp family chromosome partitioning ATPase